MKRFLVAAFVCVLATMPAMAVDSLGGWPIGAPGSVHVVWDFSAGTVAGSGSGYDADTSVSIVGAGPIHLTTDNTAGIATITGLPGSTLNYDSIKGSFSSDGNILVELEIFNFDQENPQKIIWVDVDTNGTVSPLTLGATDGGTTSFTKTFLPTNGVADFGALIQPNPFKEDISFLVIPTTVDGFGPTSVAYVCLDGITVDTLCVPAPGALLLAGLGASLVGWLRRRSLV